MYKQKIIFLALATFFGELEFLESLNFVHLCVHVQSNENYVLQLRN